MTDIVAGYKARLQEIERDLERVLRNMEVSDSRYIEDYRTYKAELLGRLVSTLEYTKSSNSRLHLYALIKTDHEQVKDASDGTDVNTSSEPVPREGGEWDESTYIFTIMAVYLIMPIMLICHIECTQRHQSKTI
jgi:hypothetical protein